MQTFLRKEQSHRAIFGAIVFLLSIWGLFVNKKEISSFYYLHIFRAVLSVVIGVSTYCTMKFQIVEIPDREPEDAEEAREDQQQQREQKILETSV